MKNELVILLQGIPCSCKQFNVGASTAALYCTDDRNILFNTGPYSERVLLTAKLKAQGLTPKDIDTVVLSQLHWDTAMNIDMFKNAKIYVNEEELNYALNPSPDDPATPLFLGRSIQAMPQVMKVKGDEEIAPGVTIVELSGNTVGSIGLLIGKTLLAGDAIPTVRCAKNMEVEPIYYDKKAASASLTKALELADVIYPGHDRPFVYKQGIEVLGETNLRIRFFFNPVGQDQEVVIKSEKPQTFVTWP
jgi:Zn-dependent hydrolases, including glyoxylases